MASKISTGFLGHGLSGLSQRRSNVRITASPSYRLLPASCLMRQRSFSLQSKRQHIKKVSPEKQPTVTVNGEFDSECASTQNLSLGKQEIMSKSNVDVNDDSHEANIDASAQHLSTVQLEDLIAMIRNVEKYISLLNQARISALNDLQTIFSEKEQLQGQINSVEMKLTETGAWIRDAARDEVHVDSLEEQIEELRDELIHSERSESDIYSNQYFQLNEELRSLREENDSLKTDVQTIKSELHSFKNTDERIMILEKERSVLESNLKNLESKLSDSREDISKLSSLKFDYKVLGERVENLQVSLDKATTQANQAILDMRKNQDLRKKVNKLEESLEEANVYKLSSERQQYHMELKQQKISLLEEQLHSSGLHVIRIAAEMASVAKKKGHLVEKAMRRQLGLSNESPNQPLVGCVTRLVPQKGVLLIRHAIYRTLELEGQFVLLGSSPVLHIQKEFEAIANKFSNHDSVRLTMKYDESLSHRIFPASDMFIVPSIFEPCGLTQMIAMRYGSVPIARKTGGLCDSVFDVDDDTIPLQLRNGFTYVQADEQGVKCIGPCF